MLNRLRNNFIAASLFVFAAAVVQALRREVARIVNLPDMREKFVTGGYEVIASTPEQFTERGKRDTERYRKIILASGMQ
jgi:hypothetical protein